MVGIAGGGYLLKSGLEKRSESNIHTLAREELGQSLEAEITPRVIELEDRTVRLSGNAEDKYAQWRELLADVQCKLTRTAGRCVRGGARSCISRSPKHV